MQNKLSKDPITSMGNKEKNSTSASRLGEVFFLRVIASWSYFSKFCHCLDTDSKNFGLKTLYLDVSRKKF